MWYLVLFLSGSNGNGVATAIIPEKYATEQACRSAGQVTGKYYCIKAPENIYSIGTPIPDLPPGYYCGQYPEKCEISIPKMQDRVK